MKLIIDIPDEDYEYIKLLHEGYTDYQTTLKLYRAVKDGTPLPKGHDKLIDVGVLRKELIANEWITDDDGGGLENILHNSPIIIEADKEADS